MNDSMPELVLGKDFILLACTTEGCLEKDVPHETLIPLPTTGVQCFRCRNDCKELTI